MCEILHTSSYRDVASISELFFSWSGRNLLEGKGMTATIALPKSVSMFPLWLAVGYPPKLYCWTKLCICVHVHQPTNSRRRRVCLYSAWPGGLVLFRVTNCPTGVRDPASGPYALFFAVSARYDLPHQFSSFPAFSREEAFSMIHSASLTYTLSFIPLLLFI